MESRLSKLHFVMALNSKKINFLAENHIISKELEVVNTYYNVVYRLSIFFSRRVKLYKEFSNTIILTFFNTITFDWRFEFVKVHWCRCIEINLSSYYSCSFSKGEKQKDICMRASCDFHLLGFYIFSFGKVQ